MNVSEMHLISAITMRYSLCNLHRLHSSQPMWLIYKQSFNVPITPTKLAQVNTMTTIAEQAKPVADLLEHRSCIRHHSREG